MGLMANGLKRDDRLKGYEVLSCKTLLLNPLSSVSIPSAKCSIARPEAISTFEM
jgi:hypothetical protein